MFLYAAVMCLVYPVGVWATLFAWLWSFRERLDPTTGLEHEDEDEDEAYHVYQVIQKRKKDEVIRDAPITTVALKFLPRYWYYECITLARRW